MDKLKFIADAMLGTLARKLRLLGIDTEYLNNPGDHELEYLIRSQDRVLLTRNRNLAMRLADNSRLVSGDVFRDQFLSIAETLAPFRDHFEPFSRCLDCNRRLEPIEADKVKDRVPPYIFQSKRCFSRCPSCERIFWEGTHSGRMQEEVEWMRGVLEEENRRRGEGEKSPLHPKEKGKR